MTFVEISVLQLKGKFEKSLINKSNASLYDTANSNVLCLVYDIVKEGFFSDTAKSI